LSVFEKLPEMKDTYVLYFDFNKQFRIFLSCDLCVLLLNENGFLA